MKPVYQTKLKPPKGNCWAACVASVLECGLEEVPDVEFEQMDAGAESPDVLRFWKEWREWLADRNLGILCVTMGKGVPLPRGYVIFTGRSPRGAWDHSVVYHDGELCHDPHPEGGGIQVVSSMDMLYPLDPALPIGS